MRFHDFDLNLLVYLDALLADKSVSRAASRIGITQPAMSEALARMRAHFKDELLVPVAGRSMVLTPLAETLAGPVREILLQAQNVTDATAEFIPAKSTRKFSVQASDYVFDVLLKKVIRRLHHDAPGVRLEVKRLEVDSRQRIRRADLDLLIMPKAYVAEELPSECLFEDPVTCVVWSKNRSIGQRITLGQYLELGHVCQSTDGEMSEYDTWFARRCPRPIRVEVVVPNFGMVMQAVEGTQRIAIVHQRHARMYAKRYSLRMIKPPIDFPPLQEYLQWHRHQDGDPGLYWLRNLIKSVAAQI
jgi:LysR family nod box-dependent transcriptional activator